MLRLTDVVKHLLIINVLMFIATQVMNTDMLALYYPGSDNFQPYQLVSHFFMHSKTFIAHIFFNMFALVMFGPPLEMRWGARRFLFYYIFCALGAATLHLGYNYYEYSQMQTVINSFAENPSASTALDYFRNYIPGFKNTGEYAEYIHQIIAAFEKGNVEYVAPIAEAMQDVITYKMNTPMVGASGAIFGLLMAFGWYFPNAELMLIFLPIPIKAKYFIPIMMLLELYLGVNQFSWDNIAHFAHLGGALFGLILILIWRNTDNNSKVQRWD